ncbi:MAG: NAD(P)/FAD-dependent oxidoreductase [Polyangiaceae bacterium]|nr:NAD(P)/FAD-dependent oxidoreductase [Myxococcales bacterium]MCB9590675.1 NAD(P)/FAD-dependent oxidoreductase [Polyangiaceae bacterium]
MKNLVILGAGTAGTMLGNKLAQRLGAEWNIHLVDRDDLHVYQPGLLFIPFRSYRREEIIRPRKRFVQSRVHLNLSGIGALDVERRQVKLGDGTSLSYDILVVATGAKLSPESTEGLTGSGWRESAFDFYSLEGALALADKLDGFEEGRVLINVVDMPIKCPVAPLEFAFLADAYFKQKNVRDAVELHFVTPLDGAFTKPRASALLGGMLQERQIHLETSFATSSVDGAKRELHSYDGRKLDYDLLVSIPLHNGSDVMLQSGLADESGFVKTDKHTLASRVAPGVFAIGDATDLPTSKAGSVAHFQAEVLLENILRDIRGQSPLPDFDGHANCFIETGSGRGILIDFNYETEPLPGKFPLPGVGPFDLLRESRVNHWGKLGFKWVYWNLLLAGEELPLDHRMLMAGKWS